MKNLIIFLVLIFTFQSVQSQVTDSLTVKSKQEMYDFYIAKNKKLKTTGSVLLGTGVAAMGVGFALTNNSDVLDSSNDWGYGAGFMLVGSLSAISSMPVFIMAKKHKRKAEAILGSGEVGIGAIPFNDTKYASVGIKISF